MTRDDLDESERTRVEVYTRVMGYHRPVAYFNAGKQQEHRDRKFYEESKVRA
jgi:anaerobic ribonucleoside-triphosphate reductase